MSEPKRISPPLSDEDIMKLKIGDRVLITGKILTGRDSAHKRLYDLIHKGESLQDRPRPIAWIHTHRYSWNMG
jgi:tartrate dehydratase beta subunit/fumarate hydratase class I family protein